MYNMYMYMHVHVVSAMYMCLYTVEQETFEGENFRKFQGFGSIRESFLHENQQPHPHVSGGAKQSTKLFFANFLLPPIRQSLLPQKFPIIWYLDLIYTHLLKHLSLFLMTSSLSSTGMYWISASKCLCVSRVRSVAKSKALAPSQENS